MFQDPEDTELYLRLVECVIQGPASISQTEAEARLDIESWQYSRVQRPEAEERPEWRPRGRTGSSPEPRGRVWLVEPEGPRVRAHDRSCERSHRDLRNPGHDRGQRQSPEPQLLQGADPQGRSRRDRRRQGDRSVSPAPPSGLRDDWKRPDLHSQFELFSKFANAGSDGTTITLRKLLSISKLCLKILFLLAILDC